MVQLNRQNYSLILYIGSTVIYKMYVYDFLRGPFVFAIYFQYIYI